MKLYYLPGSTIVVSRESRPLDGVKLSFKIITPILADLATSAAAIAAISDNNKKINLMKKILFFFHFCLKSNRLILWLQYE